MAYGELPVQKGYIDSSYRIPVNVAPKYTLNELRKSKPQGVVEALKLKDENIRNKPIFTR